MASTLEQMMENIYADSRVSPIEIMKLRKAVDAAESKIIESEGEHGTVATLFKSFDVTRQLLQDGVLEVRKGDYSDEAKEQIYAALEANVNLLKANLDAFAK